MANLSSRSNRTLLTLLTFVIAAVLFVPGHARAQSATGDLEGIVVDSQGGFLPGANVTVTSTATGVKRTIVTDEKGLFRSPLLPVGEYDVTAELNGFKPQKQAGVRVMI